MAKLVVFTVALTGQGLVTNEHERSAFAHGWYYLHTGEGAPNEEG